MLDATTARRDATALPPAADRSGLHAMLGGESAAGPVLPSRCGVVGKPRQTETAPDGRRAQVGTVDAVAGVAMRFLRQVGIELVRYYNRLDVRVEAPIPDRPCLMVANHGFGGIIDLNVFAVLGTLDKLAAGRPVTTLTHQLAWTLRLGRLVESVGCRPATAQFATEALGGGHHVLVLPGGDVDAGKSFRRRNEIDFAGRTGFARLARDAGVPVVPIVTAGAGETLFVLASGKPLARWLRLDTRFRYKVLPVTISIPWGLSVGLVGLLPYLPLPAKMKTVVMPAMEPGENEPDVAFAARIQEAMQTTMDRLVANGLPPS